MMNVLFLLTLILNSVSSVLIGRINHATITTNTTFLPTSNSQCLDCLYSCMTDQNKINSKNLTCYGINCFPLNHSCQRIERSWIQEIDISFNSTSDQFITTIDLNFCSCYTSQTLLNTYQNTTAILTSHPKTRFIKYNSYDDTFIVLGDNQISQYSASNLTRFRTQPTSDIPLNAFIDSINIYISFY